jgi:fibronectin type 3 domain-containing protein
MSGATFPVTLNPGIAIKIQVNFDPSAVGSAQGTITLSSNSSTSSSTVIALTGTGIAVHEANLSWIAPANSPVPVAGYNVYRAPSGGSAYQQLNSTAITQTTYSDSSVTSGSSYTYYVQSVDVSGDTSTPSNQVTLTIP